MKKQTFEFNKCLLKNKRSKLVFFAKTFKSKKLASFKNTSRSEEELKNAQEKVKKFEGKKGKIWSYLFLFLNLAVIAYIFISSTTENDILNFGDLLTNEINFWFLGASILCVLLLNLIDVFKVYFLIYFSTKRKRIKVSYKTYALGRYYDCITPLSIGGEPYQIYYLNKNGIRGEIATSIPLVRQLYWQTSYVLISLGLLIYNSISLITTNALLITLAWVGLAFNALLVILVLGLSLSKKIGQKIVISVLKLLNKMHIIKNYRKTFRKVMRFVKNYQFAMKYFAKNLKNSLIQVFLAVFGTFVSSLITYFVYLTFNPSASVNFIDMFTLLAICELATSIIPIPGGTIAAEFSFEALFSTFFASNVFPWALILWRTLTFYFYIIQGFFITIYDSIIGNKKARKQKSLNLPDTSILSKK